MLDYKSTKKTRTRLYTANCELIVIWCNLVYTFWIKVSCDNCNITDRDISYLFWKKVKLDQGAIFRFLNVYAKIKIKLYLNRYRILNNLSYNHMAMSKYALTVYVFRYGDYNEKKRYPNLERYPNSGFIPYIYGHIWGLYLNLNRNKKF